LSIAAGDVFFVGSSLLRGDNDHDHCHDDDNEEMEFFDDGRPQAPTPSSISSSLVLPPEQELPQQLPWQQRQQRTYDNTDMAVQSFEDHGNGVPMMFDDNYPEEEEDGAGRHYEERQHRDAAADGAGAGRRPRQVVSRRRQQQQQQARHLDDSANVGAVAWPFSQQQQQGSGHTRPEQQQRGQRNSQGTSAENGDGPKKTGCGCCIS
jgi:hypothetical protein